MKSSNDPIYLVFSFSLASTIGVGFDVDGITCNGKLLTCACTLQSHNGKRYL
jgi:hypothetical protein